MKFRATEKDIYDAVKKDTKKLLKLLNWEPKQTAGELSVDVVSDSLRKAIEHKGMTFAHTKEEVKDKSAANQENIVLTTEKIKIPAFLDFIIDAQANSVIYDNLFQPGAVQLGGNPFRPD